MGRENEIVGTLRAKLPPRQTLTRQIVSLITEEIVSQRLAPNAMLPTEQQLASELGVSRMVIRESVRILAALGLLNVRHGVGTFVNPPSSWRVDEPLALLLRTERKSLMHWWEVRAILETEIARLAAARATEDDLRELAAALDAMRDSPDLDTMVQADLEFHRLLAVATGNPLLTLLIGPIVRPMRDHLLASARLAGRREGTLSEHELLLDAVRAHDPSAAAAAMGTHLSLVAEEIAAIRAETETSAPAAQPGI